MKQETKNCQSCKKDFTIEPDDFSFYEKIKVPPPTFCPWCRLVRRMAWRSERPLYRRKCDLCSKNIIAMYHESVPFPVYCHDCWYGDGWDPVSYGRSYDMNRSLFEQFRELLNVVPRSALWQRNAINSEYSNMVGESKNVYLSASTVNCENVFYSKNTDKSSDVFDSINTKECQGVYENIEGEKNYNSEYLLLSKNCIDSYFLVDCVNCSNCILSCNLRNKEFCIRNIQYSKENYFQELEKMDLKSRNSRSSILKEFFDIQKKAIYRFANIVRSVNSTGNELSNVKNVQNSFIVYDSENLKYCYRTFGGFKDSMDVTLGIKSELIYEYITGALNDYNVRFSCSAMNSVQNADYTDSCINSKDLFGCIGLTNVQYAILNKIYPKEEFEKLRKEIIEQMGRMPFVDKLGRIYKYGEFFPIELSPWAYNETLAQELAPLIKEEAEKNGYKWLESEVKNFDITIPADKVPDSIDNVDESILKEVFGCEHEGKCVHQCTNAFRITNYELQFYKKHNISLPILCSNCRYYERCKVMPALKLWTRNCMCNKPKHFHEEKVCPIQFETAYAPDRPEKVYCERCYQAEVY